MSAVSLQTGQFSRALITPRLCRLGCGHALLASAAYMKRRACTVAFRFACRRPMAVERPETARLPRRDGSSRLPTCSNTCNIELKTMDAVPAWALLKSSGCVGATDAAVNGGGGGV